MNEAPIEQLRYKSLVDAHAALKLAVAIDPRAVGRADVLGTEMNLDSAIPGMQRAVSLLQLVDPSALGQLSVPHIMAVREVCEWLYARHQEALRFSVAAPNAATDRSNLIDTIASAHDQIFDRILPALHVSVRRTDPAVKEAQADSLLSAIREKYEQAEKDLAANKVKADEIVAAIRAASAEAAVWKQGHHFKNEADKHEKEAKKWLSTTRWLLAALAILAFVGMFQHLMPGFRGVSVKAWVQVGVSKALIFGSIAFFMVLSSRNYLAHRHNEVVNRHRQNSLQTYQAIVEAAGDHANRDIVLMKAAESIFGPQSTGYSKLDGEDGKALSMVNVGMGLIRPPAPGQS